MGFFSSLFGGPEQVQVMTDDQMHFLKAMTDRVGGQIGHGINPYQGQITPGATGNQGMAFAMAPGLMTGGQYAQDMEGARRRAITGAPAYTADPAARERYYNDSVLEPARAQFNDTLRQVDARYGDRWSQDSGAHKANVYDAVSNFETGLAGIRGDLLYRDEQNAINSMERGADRSYGSLTSLPATDRANLGTLAALGGQERAIEGQAMGEEYNKWLMSQPWANPWLGYSSQVLSAQPFQVAQSPGMLGGIGGVLSGAGSIWGRGRPCPGAVSSGTSGNVSSCGLTRCRSLALARRCPVGSRRPVTLGTTSAPARTCTRRPSIASWVSGRPRRSAWRRWWPTTLERPRRWSSSLAGSRSSSSSSGS